MTSITLKCETPMNESDLPLYNRPSFQAARARHARRMAIIGIIQIIAVIALVSVKIYNAYYR